MRHMHAMFAALSWVLYAAGVGFAVFKDLIQMQEQLDGRGRAAAVVEDVKRWLRMCGARLAAHPW